MIAQTIDPPKYRELLDEALPRVVRDEAQNEVYLSRLEALYESDRPLSLEEKELAALLTVLIQTFESTRYSLPRANPVETLRALMEANGIMQKDLVDVFGQESVVSEVLKGKRGLSKAHIVRLARRFHVSPELFLDCSQANKGGRSS